MQPHAQTLSVRIGFLPTFRFHYSEWCERMHRENRALLAAIPGACVVDAGDVEHGAVHTLDEAEAAARHFITERVEAIVVCPLDFGDERSVAHVADRCHVPLLLYATDEPPACEDSSLSRVSDSYCGTLSIAVALRRRALPFRFAGIFMPDNPLLKKEMEEFTAAAAVAAGMRGARIGQVGVRPPAFETVAYDERALIKSFGQYVITRNVDDIVAAARALPADDERLRLAIADFKNSVAQCSVHERYFEDASRMELALADFYGQEKLSALTMQCWPSVGRSMGLEVCAIFGRLTNRGMLTACETDVLGALSMLMQYRAGMGASLPHFIDWTIRHRSEKNSFLAWHCGNAPPCLARDPGDIRLRSRANMSGAPDVQGKGGLFQFQLREGPVTLCRLAEYDGRFKLLVTSGVIVPSKEELAGTWAWVRVVDHERLYRTLIEEGFIHHASMMHGDQSGALATACHMLGIQVVTV